MKLHQRITQLTILPAGEPIDSVQAMHVFISPQDGYESVKVANISGSLVSINPKEWSAIRDGIDRMMAEISEWEEITTDTKQ